MESRHSLVFSDARNLDNIAANSIDLVVTSPPYPMIQMWDDLFSTLSAGVKTSLENDNGNAAFEAMHIELDKVWEEMYRVLKSGSFACINIGDATRTIGGRFQLYPNHARIVSAFRRIGFDTLPLILWRKQTNAPNKFMGSGMLPSGAYVTLEHEYILLFRKGAKKDFNSALEKEARMNSSFFWEERNKWFSDVWDFKGTTQALNNSELRSRSAAFPLELAYRLINMYSLYGDTVLDPFMGTGTTALAAITCARNSVGVEIDKEFCSLILEQEKAFMETANEIISTRILAHNEFVEARRLSNGELKYINNCHGFPVMTRQEIGIKLQRITNIHMVGATETVAVYESIGKLADNESCKQEIAVSMQTGSHQLSLGF